MRTAPLRSSKAVVLAAVVAVLSIAAFVVAGRADPLESVPSAAWRTPLDGYSQTKTSETLVVAGRVKIATIVSGTPAKLQVLDVHNGAVEDDVVLDGMSAGEALAVDSAGRIYAGGNSPWLYRFTPGSSAVENLGRVTRGSTHIFSLATAPDGEVWGGSYPTAEVWHVEPSTREIVVVGKARDDASYARRIAVDSRHAYVAVGPAHPSIVQIDVQDTTRRASIPLPSELRTGIIGEVQALGRFLSVSIPAGRSPSGAAVPAQRRLYDIADRSWEVPANIVDKAPSPLDSSGSFYYLSGRRLWSVDSRTGVRRAVAPTTATALRDRHVITGEVGGRVSQWLIGFDSRIDELSIVDLVTGRSSSRPVRLEPVPMQIKSLSTGGDGRLFVGGFGGASLSVVNVRTGAKSEFPRRPAPGTIGEIEGSISAGRYQYLGSYTGGEIFRYDRMQPWIDGRNPTVVADLGVRDGQDRPRAWAEAERTVYFGTIPKYGQLGGGLGIIAPSQPPRFIRDLVADQSVVSLAASGDVVFGGSSRWGGLGASPVAGGAVVFAYDAAAGRVLWQVSPEGGAQAFGAVALDSSGRLWAAQGGTLYELDRATGRTLRTRQVMKTTRRDKPTYNSSDLVVHGDTLLLATGGAVHAVDPDTLRSQTLVPSGVTLPEIAVVDDELYYPVGAHLERVSLRPPQD